MRVVIYLAYMLLLLNFNVNISSLAFAGGWTIEIGKLFVRKVHGWNLEV